MKPRRGRPPRADKAATERIEIRVTRLERAELERAAALQGITVSEWIRQRCSETNNLLHTAAGDYAAAVRDHLSEASSAAQWRLDECTRMLHWRALRAVGWSGKSCDDYIDTKL